MRAIGDFESINLATGAVSRRVSGDGESVLVRSERRLGPQPEAVFGPNEFDPSIEEIQRHVRRILKQEQSMHYRNGREAKNGDKIVQIGNEGKIEAVGVLHDATPGNDYCNGRIAPIHAAVTVACMCDCLHLDDVAAMLKEKGFDKRPAGK